MVSCERNYNRGSYCSLTEQGRYRGSGAYRTSHKCVFFNKKKSFEDFPFFVVFMWF